jgi:hypothetical protein
MDILQERLKRREQILARDTALKAKIAELKKIGGLYDTVNIFDEFGFNVTNKCRTLFSVKIEDGLIIIQRNQEKPMCFRVEEFDALDEYFNFCLVRYSL